MLPVSSHRLISLLPPALMGPDDGNSGLGRELAEAALEDAAVRWQKVKDLFGDALEQDPAERKAFLDNACNGDEALRAEVESLLAAAQDPTDEAQAEPEPDRMLGRRLGAYQIVESVASGGMATVYLAHRADDQYRKRVAIKLIHPGLANDALCRRFRSERQTLAALDHPNIVKLLDGGTTEEGLPYLVMDYVDGQAIDEYCDQRQLTVEERLKLFRTVCGAVEHAHQNRIIHRDLKPSNILVTADGSPRLLDFGIAKLLNRELSPEMGLMTTVGIHHMTPAYASPEQARGDEITYASDAYSLGVVLYELLTGHRPYRFKSYTAAEVERVICETEAERPSTIVTRAEPDQGPEGSSGHVVTPDGVSRARGVPLEKLRRRLKGDLDNIMLKALHKEPQRRYRSVEEFSEDIARHLEDRPVKARPNTLQYRTRKFVRRRKTEMVALVLLLVLAGGWGFSLRRQGFWHMPFIPQAGANKKAGVPVLGLQSEIARSVANEVTIKTTPEERALLDTHNSVNVTALEANLRGVYHLNGSGGGVSDHEREIAISFFQHAIAEDPTFTRAYLNLEDAYEGLLLPANQRMPLARTAAEKALALDPDLSDAHVTMGRVKFFYEWDFVGAGREFKRAIDLNPNSAGAHSCFARYLSATGRVDEGRAEYELAKRLRPMPIHYLGFGYVAPPGYEDRSIAELRRYLEFNPDDRYAHVDLADLYARKGMQREHVAELQKTLALFGFPKSSNDVAASYAAFGYRAALRAWALALDRNGMNRPVMVAQAYARLGDNELAFQWLERAFREHDDHIVYLNVEPSWDTLRSDPRFKDLVRRVGLPEVNIAALKTK